MKKLEEELFYNQMCKLFGETEDHDNKPTNDDTIYEKCFYCERCSHITFVWRLYIC